MHNNFIGPVLYVGWCRPRGGHWSIVPGTESAIWADCYRSLIEATELRGQQPIGNSLLILKRGEVPPAAAQTYRNRMMRTF